MNFIKKVIEEENINKINWTLLCQNETDYVLDLIYNNIDRLDYENISGNRNNKIVKLLNKYPDKIDWVKLSGNESDEAIKLLKKYPENIIYYYLSENTNLEAVKLLYEYYIKNKLDKYILDNWINFNIPFNPKIFVKNEFETNKNIDDFIKKIIT